MEFMSDNWMAISAAVAAVLTVAGLIAKKTKNKTDDKVVGILNGLLGFLGGRAKK